MRGAMKFDIKGMSPVAQLAVVIGSLALASTLLGIFFLPRYLEYMAGREQLEAVGNLREIYTAERGYFQKNRRYTDSFTELGYSPTGSYTYYLGRSVQEGSAGGTYPLPGSVQTYASETGFKAAAVSNLDDDADMDVWTVDQSGVIMNVFNDFNKPRLRDFPSSIRQVLKKKMGRR